jgi:transcriptional regulator with XRE-family HTH domain
MPTRLQALREAQGLSRERLAGLAEISPRTIYNIEVKGTSPHRLTANAIAFVLGVDAGWLLTKDVEAPGKGLDEEEPRDAAALSPG